MTTTSIADAKNRLSEIVASAVLTHERTIITKNGRPAAIVLSIEDFESIEETLEILSDPEAVHEIREGVAAADRGEFVSDDDMRAIFTRLDMSLPAQLR